MKKDESMTSAGSGGFEISQRAFVKSSLAAGDVLGSGLSLINKEKGDALNLLTYF